METKKNKTGLTLEKKEYKDGYYTYKVVDNDIVEPKRRKLGITEYMNLKKDKEVKEYV